MSKIKIAKRIIDMRDILKIIKSPITLPPLILIV